MLQVPHAFFAMVLCFNSAVASHESGNEIRHLRIFRIRQEHTVKPANAVGVQLGPYYREM